MAERKKYNFAQISAKICENQTEHEQNIRKLCTKAKVQDLNKVYEDLREVAAEISNLPTENNADTVEDYANIFKSLDCLCF